MWGVEGGGTVAGRMEAVEGRLASGGSGWGEVCGQALGSEEVGLHTRFERMPEPCL